MSSRVVTVGRLLALSPERHFALVTGCFDILHAGHIQLLDHAFLLCSHVWVGLNSDQAVRELKGEGRPINAFAQRAKVMAALRYVEYVFEIDALRVDGIIKELRPTWWVKGGAYTLATLDPGEVAAAKEVGAEIVLAPFMEGQSTTAMLKRGA